MLRICKQGLSAKLDSSVLLVLMFILSQAAWAQTVTILYSFPGGGAGHSPVNGLTPDGHGNFYGTTHSGGADFGTVFKLTRHSSGYSFTPLYSFQGGSDGYGLLAVLLIGPDGSLFGSTYYGGTMDYGTIFNLRPPEGVCPAVSCAWTHTVLYSFTGQEDGMYPMGGLAFDQQGNLYGSTYGYSGSRDSHQYPALRNDVSGNPSVWLSQMEFGPSLFSGISLITTTRRMF
jgi:uncharacterized repeat protein (TIGR03803 family)